MRLLIKFNSQQKTYYRQNQLTGLVYFLIGQSGFGSLHDLAQKNYRFFNFSQLFLADSYLSLIFSSPIEPLIEALRKVLRATEQVNLNGSILRIKEVTVLSTKIFSSVLLKTETPVVVRIPKERYKEYGLKLTKPYPYFYWRPITGKSIPFEPFIRQLEGGAYKKYKLFTGRKIEEEPIFTKFIYKKTVDLPYFKNDQKISRIGTLWEFEINPEIDKKIVEFILDVGLGELNSQGYGFMSIKQD